MTRSTHAGQMEEKMGAPSDEKHLLPSRHAACISVPVLPAGTILPQRSVATQERTAEAPRDNCTPREYVTGKTCRSNSRPRPAPLNIDNSVTTRPTNTSPRTRHRVAKAPKPVPYLKPVPSSAARRLEGEGGRVRVRFVSSAKRRHSGSRTVSRTQSAKLPPRKELAYLIVDLRSGTPSNHKSKSSEELNEVFQQSPDTEKSDTKEPSPNTMSFTTEHPSQPQRKPIPRRRTIGSGSCSSISFINEKESTPPPAVPPKPEKKPTPAPRKPRVFSPTHAHSEGPSEEQEQVSSPHANTSSSVTFPAGLKPVPQKKHKTPPPPTPSRQTSLPPPTPSRQKSPPPPTPLQEPESSKATTSQPAAESPPEVPARLTKSPPQSPATVKDLPPPLPEKSSLSRQVQLSVKKNRRTPLQSALSSTKPLEAENDDLDSMNIVQNTSYITHADLSADTAESIYTEPLMPSKPKPARPPPPSSSAIQRAKERKEKVLANRKLQTTTRSLTKTLHPASSCSMRNAAGHHSTAASNTSSPSNSTHAHPVVQSSAAPRPSDYEDLDSELDHSAPSPPDTSPPVFRASRTSIASLGPPLPPRAPSSRKPYNQRTKQAHAPIPSGFTSQLDDNETDTSPMSSAGKLENEKEEEEGDGELDGPESVYEPVDASIPLAPQRTKKNIRGTQTMTMVKRNRGLTNVCVGQRTSQLKKEKGSLTDPLQRRTLNHTKQNRKPAPLSTSFSSAPRLKGSLSGSLSSEEDGIAKVSSMDMERDVGGVDEYVEMQPRPAWDEKETAGEEDKPEDTYVDMRPGNEGEESDEDQPQCGPYASSDLLSCKPELRS